MIISVHIAKTAGNSFGRLLRHHYADRFMHDDEDWAGYVSPEAIARRVVNARRMRQRRDELVHQYDVIHGHFIADKYVGMFAVAKFIAFFRDPFQQAVSHYEFLRRIPHAVHPAIQEFHEAKMTIEDFVSWQATREPQAHFMGSLAVEDLELVGLTEEFPRSLMLFNAMFGQSLGSEVFENTNPARPEGGYSIDSALRKVIEMHRPKDIDIYRRATERFAQQLRKQGI